MNKVLDKFFTKADNGTVRLYDYDVTHLWLAGVCPYWLLGGEPVSPGV